MCCWRSLPGVTLLVTGALLVLFWTSSVHAQERFPSNWLAEVSDQHLAMSLELRGTTDHPAIRWTIVPGQPSAVDADSVWIEKDSLHAILAPGVFIAGKLGANSIVGTWTDHTYTSALTLHLAEWYLGSVKIGGGTRLRLLLEVSPAAGLGALVSLDQGNAFIPATLVAQKRDSLRVEFRSIQGSFRGIRKGTSGLSGTWRQGSAALPLTLKKIDSIAAVKRPQDPVPPYPYVSEDVKIVNPDAQITLAGTFTYPRSDAKSPKSEGKFPAVLLITGSGPQDRDEALLGHRPFLVLADYLTRHGIAVLRCDDRGTARSGGNFATATSIDFAGDVGAEFDYLLSRKEVDSGRAGLLGHSEGGMIAPVVAASDPNVKFIVMMAGAGVPSRKLMHDQRGAIGAASGANPLAVAMQAVYLDAIDSIAASPLDSAQAYAAIGKIWDKMIGFMSGGHQLTPDQQATIERQKRTQTAEVLSPWYRTFIGYDPAPTLAHITVPVLAIGGSLDTQVPARENLHAIDSVFRASGNARVTTREFIGLNHLFQHAKTGAPSEYQQIEETISPEVLATISDWILALPSGHKH